MISVLTSDSGFLRHAQLLQRRHRTGFSPVSLFFPVFPGHSSVSYSDLLQSNTYRNGCQFPGSVTFRLLRGRSAGTL